jgi:hypothetical protein
MTQLPSTPPYANRTTMTSCYSCAATSMLPCCHSNLSRQLNPTYHPSPELHSQRDRTTEVSRFSTPRTTEGRQKSPANHPRILEFIRSIRLAIRKNNMSTSCYHELCRVLVALVDMLFPDVPLSQIDQSTSVAHAHSRGHLQRPSSVPGRPEQNSLCPKKLFGLTRTSLTVIEQCFCTSPPSASSPPLVC